MTTNYLATTKRNGMYKVNGMIVKGIKKAAKAMRKAREAGEAVVVEEMVRGEWQPRVG